MKLRNSAFWRTIVIAIVLLACAVCVDAQDKKEDKHHCEGTTKAGAPCQHITADKYCKQHDPATPRCGVLTKAGKPCARPVKNQGEHCFQHSKA